MLASSSASSRLPSVRAEAVERLRHSVRSPLAGEGQDEGAFEEWRSPEDIYRSLMAARSEACDAFDAHVVASIVAIAFSEADGDAKLIAAVGLDGDELSALLAQFFPGANALAKLAAGGVIERGADEECLLDLLQRGATSRTPFEARLAAMIARRAQQPNHLWQDLGLTSRRDLSELMMRHFKPLARRNSRDMKWKKFLYRMICADASYALCTAPSCSECDDFDVCFGEETGESLLARNRRSVEAVG